MSEAFDVEQYRDGSVLERRLNLHDLYSTATTPWFEWVTRRIEWERGAYVLEVGCGAGWLWERARDVLPRLHLWLSDLSYGMVDEACATAIETGHYFSVDGLVADAQRLPIPDAQFDVAVADHMLYLVPDPRLAVAELARVLAPGGVLIAATNGARHLRELAAIRGAVFGAEHGRTERADRFGPENGFAMLREHFVNVEWVSYPDVLECTNPDDVIDYLVSSGPGSGGSDGLRELERAVRAAFVAGDGVLRVTTDTGAFVAV